MRRLLYSFIIFSALSLAGCTLPKMVKMAKEQQLTATPNPLEVHKDTVAFELSASLPVKMLKKGTVYSVNTFYKYGESEIAFADITEVSFHELTDEQIIFYVDKYEPYDKAGAYAIQEWIGVVGIKSVTGDFYNVMGLPVSRVVQALHTINL